MNKQTLTALKAGAAPLVLGFALLSSGAQAQDAADDTASGPAIVVTGSRIVAPNQASIAPITTVTSQDIQLQGTTRTEDLLNSLPQVVAGQSSGLANGATGTATVDLRGLGPSRTLVLINGRRLMTGDPNSTTSAADLNFIPAALVKRVDVLTGGASATYGADAVAGVVNFVMDTEFEGFKIDANYGLYTHKNKNGFIGDLLDAKAGDPAYAYPRGSNADGGQYDLTAAFGTSFDDGRGHATAYVGYRRATPVLQRKRDYSSCSIGVNAAGKFSCGGSATAAPGNVLYYDPALNTSSSTIGALGAGTITPQAQNIYNFAPLNYYQRPDERYTAGVFADYEINTAIHPYMEFMFMDDRTVAQIAPSGDFGNTLTINCDNPLMSASQRSTICAPTNLINGFLGNFPLSTGAPYNTNPANWSNLDGSPTAFTDPTTGATYNKAYMQLLRRNVEGGARQSDLQHTSFRTVIGSRGELGKAWSYDAYYQYGRTNYSQVYSNEFSAARLANALDVVQTANGPACRVAVTGQDTRCAPYDVFSGNISQASLDYLTATGFMKGQTSQQVASASFTGMLGEYGIKSPWASDGVNVALGVEYRRDSLELKTDNAFTTGDLTGQGAPTLDTNGSYKVTEFFGEIDIPIVQDSFIQNLSFNGGYRYSHYSISNGRTFNTSTYKLGVDLAPVSDIRLRAGYNRAVRVPNIQELFAPQIVALDGSTDPCAVNTGVTPACAAQGMTGGTSANPASQYNGLIGGNPDLNPEKSTTKTLGVVLQPRWVPGLTASVDWFDIKVKQAIQQYGADAILAACGVNEVKNQAACDLVNRDPSGSLWLTSGGYVVDIFHNVGGVKTRGFEFNGNYSTEIGNAGRVSLSFVGTWLNNYIVDNGLTEQYNCAGYYGVTCGTPLPKWRHKARVSYTMSNGVGLSLQWRHLSSATVEYANPSSSLAPPNQNIVKNVNSLDDKLKAMDYFDLTLTADLGKNLTWRLGATNLLDKDPPLVTSNACASVVCNGNAYPGTYDVLGRYVFTGITMNF
ncbi:TonB-dependent receptor-like protein [Novosphingobium sp. PhB57]|uniref:TonB-dependent receptor domain-containing protein n=1 Tax=Novosphingobium sp. PhB57 TaxID=2485107 RepID=UPI0010EAC750|nr:TonB-dependent receptor [Novosphingobium sp. PhB57]TCU61841.1 TonB-dependent receptor-like protein [Novosphingobium sp. PhB57]